MSEDKKKVMEQVVEMMLTSNKTNGQIAKAVGVTPQTISNWNGRKDFQEIREAMIRNAFHRYAPKALMTMVTLMGSARSEKVRLDAAIEILDRGGFVMVEKLDIGGAVQFINDVPTND